MRRLLGQAFIALGGPQPRIVRMVFGAGAWFVCLVLTLDPVFARLAAQHFFGNRFKIGLRFLAWSVQYGWLKKQVAHDPLFICTLFLDVDEIGNLAARVEKRRERVPLWISASDLICIYANLAQAALLAGDRNRYRHWHALHAREAGDALPAVEHIRINQKRLADEIGQQARFVTAEDADAALKDFDAACQEQGVEWFVVSGTLLGIVREGGWLAHDYDIDVGIMMDDFPGQVLIETLVAGGVFTLEKFDRQVRFFGPNGDVGIEEVPACIKLTHRNGVPFDVFIHHREGETCWHGSAINRWNNSAFDLKSYDFRGHTVLGPEDFDRYLTENYGGWRVPVTDFHSTDGSGTPNLVLVRNLFIIGLCIKRMVSVDEATRLRLFAMLKGMGAALIPTAGAIIRIFAL